MAMDEVNQKTGREAEFENGSMILAQSTNDFCSPCTMFLKTLLSDNI